MTLRLELQGVCSPLSDACIKRFDASLDFCLNIDSLFTTEGIIRLGSQAANRATNSRAKQTCLTKRLTSTLEDVLGWIYLSLKYVASYLTARFFRDLLGALTCRSSNQAGPGCGAAHRAFDGVWYEPSSGRRYTSDYHSSLASLLKRNFFLRFFGANLLRSR